MKHAAQRKNGLEEFLRILPEKNCTDTFTELEPGVWRWTRHSETPRPEMKLEFKTVFASEFCMVPAVNYNGNGWGDSVEYTGDEFEHQPWIYAYHRVSVPACTYSAGNGRAAALFGEPSSEMSCSILRGKDGTKHSLIWPEQEGPKALSKRRWHSGYRREMAPRTEFSAIIMAYPAPNPRTGWHSVLDYAWRTMAHPQTPHKKTDLLWKLGCAYAKILWKQESYGNLPKDRIPFAGFRSGMWWDFQACEYRFTSDYDVGWIGQNASLANSMLCDFLRTGSGDSLRKGLSVLDNWCSRRLESGILLVRFNTDYEFECDACNNGTAAKELFLSAKLAEQCGVSRPEYRKTALGICEFALKHQNPDGSFAKSWNLDGTVCRNRGTVGSFLIEPLLIAARETKDNRYLTAAERAFQHYNDEFQRNGFTTAGALDSYCIDKESASPMLSSALALYDMTKDGAYLSDAERIAWYLATWQWHYSIRYAPETVLGELHFDTLGMTAVSTAHNALDQYGLRFAAPLLKLAELTGNAQWSERAWSIWCSSTQLISDGTEEILGYIRPAGSQDEAVCHTNWARLADDRVFIPTQYMNVWPTAFRLEILRSIPDRNALEQAMPGPTDGKPVPNVSRCRAAAGA